MELDEQHDCHDMEIRLYFKTRGLNLSSESDSDVDEQEESEAEQLSSRVAFSYSCTARLVLRGIFARPTNLLGQASFFANSSGTFGLQEAFWGPARCRSRGVANGASACVNGTTRTRLPRLSWEGGNESHREKQSLG